MDEEIIIEGDQETHHHYEGGGCCEHCAEHAERIALLERAIGDLSGEIHRSEAAGIRAESLAEEAIVQAELAQEVAEASAIVAIEAIDQATEEDTIDDRTDDPGNGIDPGPETSQEAITVQVEPEKPKQAKQPGYGFRRGRGR